MDKSYTRVIFVDSPATTTPLSASNLNVMDDGIDNLEDRVIDEFAKVGYKLTYASNRLSLYNNEGTEISYVIVSGGGGSGSTVSVNPILSEGEEIAEITVDGETYQLYAPSGGSGGTTNYNSLSNRPSLYNSVSGSYVTLTTGMNPSDLNIATASDLSELSELVGSANTLLASLL